MDARLLRELSERGFQDQVVKLARSMGWWHHHEHDSRRSTPGLPDLLLVRPPRVLFAELKKEPGPRGGKSDKELRPDQAVVIEMFRRCPGIEVYSWIPSDWDAIVVVLRGQKVRERLGLPERS